MDHTNFKLLKSIKEIVELKEIILDSDLRAKIGDDLSSTATQNALLINVYRMVYLSQGHKVVGYIVEPKEGEKLPCIVYNRGGSNDFGSIKLGKLFLGLSMFARVGYITIFSQYSGNSGSEGVDEMGGSDIEDVLILYEILKKYSRADVLRVGMYGASRGGIMTYLALSRVDWIKAVVVVDGPTDLVKHKDFRPEMEEHYTRMFGNSVEERKKRSVLYWVDKLPKNVPLLLMHGIADWRVNPLDSIHMAEALYKNKIPHKLIMYDGADHGLTEYKKESNLAILKWFDRFVKNNEPLPNIKPHGK